jgi:hypothetical protein
MAHCIHGTHWDGVSAFFCPQCEPGRPGPEVARLPDEAHEVAAHKVARLRAEILAHVEQWAALGKLLDHAWDTGPKPDCLVEDVRQLIEESARSRALGRREGLQQALDVAVERRNDGRLPGEYARGWRTGIEAVMERVSAVLSDLPHEADRARTTLAEAREQGRLEERASICADIRASAVALDKVSDLHPVRTAIRPVIRDALLNVAKHYESGKHMAAEPTR